MFAMGVQRTRDLSGRLLGAVFTLVVGVFGGAAFAQELVVRIDGQVIETNAEHLFADTPVGATSQVVVVIRNEGSQTLEFTETPPVMMSGGFVDQFELVQPALEAGDTLSPNGSSAFAVRFSPQFASGLSLFTHIYLWTNASATPFHLIVRGRAASPEMVVTLADEVIEDLAEVAFEDTNVGEFRELVFTIANEGNAPLELTEDPPVFISGGLGESVMTVVQQPNSPIAPGGESDFRVRFTPVQGRLYSTRLFIPVNEDSTTVNTVFDIDLAGFGVLTDCNENGVDDADDLAEGDSADCNSNDIPDECDIAAGTGNDANENLVPDACEDDCNGNGLPDDFDISSGFSDDCDADGTPDDCEGDFDNDGYIDDCDNCPAAVNMDQADGDNDGLGDACDPTDDSTQAPTDGEPGDADDADDTEPVDTGDDEPQQQVPDDATGGDVSQPVMQGDDAGDDNSATGTDDANETLTGGDTNNTAAPAGVGCGAGAVGMIPLLMLGMVGLRTRPRSRAERSQED